MKLERIAELNLDVPEEIAALDISSLTANSADVTTGSLFFGLPGVNVDGASFAAQAQANGAVAAIVSIQSDVGDVSIPVWRCEDPRRARFGSMINGLQPA